MADDLPIPSTFLTSDEIKDIIKAKLLGKREDHAEDEILKLCETNGIKGAKKNNIIKYYKAEKKEQAEILKSAVEETTEVTGLRIIYPEICNCTDPIDQFNKLKEKVALDWVKAREDDALAFIKNICDVCGIDSELKGILKKFYNVERAEYLKTTTAQQKKEPDKQSTELYINDEARSWVDYEVPAVEKGYYSIRSSGIFRTVETYNETTGLTSSVVNDVCRTPFVLCGISEPLNDDTVFYKVRYITYEEVVKEFWASQSALLSKKELKTLFLQKGINCPENNLLVETVDYISRSIGNFGARYKKEFSAKRNGWNDDKTIFVLGDRAVTSDGIKPILSVGGGKGFPELTKTGSIEGWIKGTKDIMDYDLIRFKCYDSLTAPLKAILGIESHATDHYGNTSCGKTFSAQIALSMIGDAEGLTIGAKSTAKGILVHIRDFSDLPVLIDESSDAGDHLADLVYPLTSNKGRVKSTVDGQRDGGEEFHTSTMFTGERPIRDCLTNSGQQYRVNELEDTLPDLPTKQINAVKKAIQKNHGHIIELYLQKVFEWREKGTLQITYDTCFDKLPENGSNIEGRSRSIFACIMTAGYILEQVFYDIGMPNKKAIPIVKEYFKKCIQDKPIELEYIRALRTVLDWINSDFGRFVRLSSLYENKISIMDKSKTYGFVDENYIDIIGTEFSAKIAKEGFSPMKIKEDWWKQGITVSNDKVRPGTYRTSNTYYGSYAGVRINRAIAEELVGYNTEANESEEKGDVSQYDKIKWIVQTVDFLTSAMGSADIQLIRQILKYSDVDELLSILSRNGKILKMDQTSFKSVF